MRNLLRCLSLAALLLAAMTGALSAKIQSSSPVLEACENGGECSVSGAACVHSGQCGGGQTCVCY
jgi:hypothetical protein